ncbi:ABC transporter permease subunit [Microbacterium betulae]|uniref:ABC transporter permease subunit n=1 Tax=Microbacterium betulae TaxID=2981139 RepID=A0AA97FHW0_9MICO|nr:ABC transporter permease subunit [Microbacterium sp. AB]WOF22983.1 ABC transporter permease subunit [Microbacterium sp. AB]
MTAPTPASAVAPYRATGKGRAAWAAVRGALPAAAVVLGVVGAWEIASRTVLAGVYALPAPSLVVERFVEDIGFAWPNVVQTGLEALYGWTWGNLVAVLAAAVFILVRPIEVLFFRLFVALYCLPIVALAPILTAIMPGGQASIVISAQGVFFTTLVALLLGLRGADPAALDLVAVSGGGRMRRLLLVQLPASLPSLFSGLRIAAPAAVLGAVVGEYLGAKSGLGIAMVYAQQSLDITRTWGLALSTTLLAAAFYIATVLAERLLVPWMNHHTAIQTLPSPAVHAGGPVRRIVVALGSAALSLALIVAVWWAAVAFSGLSPYFMKTPGDVAAYLFRGAEASTNRAVVGSSLAVTVRDTLVGYAAGTLAAVLAAAATSVSRPVRSIATPFVIAMRAVPLVAMTPLFVLLFGRGLGVVVFIAGLVAFLPSYVTISGAMDRAPRAGRDLVTVNGGGALSAVRHILLPASVPAILAAARVAAPTAMLGAFIAEWLATGEGLGSDMLRAAAAADYLFVWSSVAATVLVSLGLYALATVAESAVLRRLGG